jgi:hypothetical protein
LFSVGVTSAAVFVLFSSAFLALSVANGKRRARAAARGELGALGQLSPQEEAAVPPRARVSGADGWVRPGDFFVHGPRGLL